MKTFTVDYKVYCHVCYAAKIPGWESVPLRSKGIQAEDVEAAKIEFEFWMESEFGGNDEVIVKANLPILLEQYTSPAKSAEILKDG